MAWRDRRLLVLAVLLAAAVVVTLMGAISLVGIWYGYDTSGQVAISAGWLLVSGLLALGAILLLMGPRRWQAYIAIAALISAVASVVYWSVWWMSDENPDAASLLLAGAAWAGAAVFVAGTWWQLLLLRARRSKGDAKEENERDSRSAA